MNKSRTSEALCRCDELRFGDFSPFDDHEKAGLKAAFKTIAQLRDAFQYGFNQYRVSVGVPGKEELREQVDLTEAILLSILSRDDNDPPRRGLRTLPIQIPYLKREIQEKLEDRFAQFTRWAKAKSDGLPELWSAAMIARVVEDEYFDEEGQNRIELAIEDNGESRGRRGCDVPMIVHLLSIRLLEGLARGHRPVGRSLSPDIRLAFRMYGEPLCQIVWHEEATRVIGTAYWLDLGVNSEGHDVPWIRALAEFLVAKRFNYRLGHSRFAALQEPKVLASFDQIFGGCAEPRGRPAAQQLPLFDWLG
jgi:hypothetical protein